MAYFVTGATGFIGRFLVKNLMKRGQPIYVLVRKGSVKKLDDLREEWGATDKDVITGHRRSRQEEPRRRRRRPQEAQGQGGAHVPPRRDLRPQGDRRRAADGQRRGYPPRGGVRAGGNGGMLPSRELDRGRGVVRRGLPRGHVRRGGRPRPSVLQDQARLRRHRSQRDASGRIASTVPASSSATRRPATSTRSTGRTTSSSCCRRMREALPPWVPMLGIEGGRINIVPVDFVADALDFLAHKKGLDGKCFHLTDPAPHRIGEVLNIFARAGHAPQMTMRLNARMFGFIPAPILYGLGGLAPVQAHDPRGSQGPRHSQGRVLVHQLADALRQSRSDQGAQGLRHRGARAHVVCAAKLWDYWERNLDPDLFIDRSLGGRVQRQGRRRHRRLVGHRQGDRAQARRRRARKVILVARGEEKLVETKQEIEAAGGKCWMYTADVSDLASCDALVARVLKEHGALRLPREQRGPLDPPRRDQLVRPLPRLRADDAAQLLRRAAPHHGLPAEA